MGSPPMIRVTVWPAATSTEATTSPPPPPVAQPLASLPPSPPARVTVTDPGTVPAGATQKCGAPEYENDADPSLIESPDDGDGSKTANDADTMATNEQHRASRPTTLGFQSDLAAVEDRESFTSIPICRVVTGPPSWRNRSGAPYRTKDIYRLCRRLEGRRNSRNSRAVFLTTRRSTSIVGA